MMRPTTSGVPPAAKGTITRTGLPGYCVDAGATAHKIPSAAVKATTCRPCNRRRRRVPRSMWVRGSTRLKARQQLQRVLALDGAEVIATESPGGDALVDLGAVAERKIRPVHDLRDRHHLEQRRDLARSVALRQFVVKLSEFGERTIGQIRRFALLGESHETAAEERKRASAVGEDPANVRKLHGSTAEDQMRDRAGGIRRVFDRSRRDAGYEAAAAIGRGRMDINPRLAPVELVIDRRKGGVAKILVLVTGQQPDAVGLEGI